MPEGLEPLAVWDTHERLGPWRCGGDGDREDRWALMIEASEWACSRVERPGDTYRVEFYLLDMPFCVVYRHRRGEDGWLCWNPETRRPYEEEPVIVPLAELPPAYLLSSSA